MGLRKKLENTLRSCLGATSLYVTSALTCVGPQTVPGELPSVNPLAGPTMTLHEGTLQRLKNEGNPYSLSFKRLTNPPFIPAGSYAVVMLNYSGGEVGLLAPLFGTPILKEAPFDVGIIATTEDNGFWTDLEMIAMDNDKPFTSGESWNIFVGNANLFLRPNFPALAITRYEVGDPTNPVIGQVGQPGSAGPQGSPGSQGPPGTPAPTPEQLYDRSFATINPNVNNPRPGQYNSSVHVGNNIARLYLDKSLEGLVGGPVSAQFIEHGQLNGQPDCFTINGQGNLTKVGEIDLDINQDGSSVRYSVYENTFNVTRTAGCPQNVDLHEVDFQLNAFVQPISDTEEAF